MSDSGAVSPLQPDEFFVWLARMVGRKGLPCEEVRYDASGSLTFRLRHPRGEARVVWRVAEPVDDWRAAVRSAPAPTDGQGWAAVLAAARRQVVARVGALRERRRHLPLLERRNREITELRLGADTLEGLCPDLLRPGVTRCAGHLFEGSSWERGALSLRFSGPAGALRYELADEERDGTPLGHYGPLRLFALDADRYPSAHERLWPYVGYALALSTRPDMTRADVLGQPPDCVDAKEPAGDRTNPFFRHDYYACGMVISAMFTSPSRVLPVFHGNRECAAFASYLTGLTETAYLHQSGMRPHLDFLRRLRTVDTDELEAIMAGSQDALTELLNDAVEQVDPELLIVMGTCVSCLIGDTVERSIYDAGMRERGIKTISFETTASERDQHHQILWSSLVRFYDGPRQGDATPGVNLLGYGHASDEVMNELDALLDALGARCCASMIPRFDVSELERFAQADLNLLFPSPLVRESVEPVRTKLRAPVLEAPPPFGLRGSARWLEAVASALGLRERAHDAVPERLERWEPRWRELVRRSEGVRLAIVLTADHPYEPDVGHRAGVPIFELLAEMGIGLDVFVIPSSRTSGSHRREAADERRAMRAALAGHPDAEVTFVRDLDELQRAVEEAPSQLLYTEEPGDRRATSAGAVPISHLDFEMGFAGACRTLERLQHAARTPFYRRYGRHLPCPTWSTP